MMRRFVLHPRSLLILMMFVGVLMVGLRLDDMWNTLINGSVFQTVTTSQAADPEPAAKAPAPEASKAAAPEAPKDTSATKGDKEGKNAKEEKPAATTPPIALVEEKQESDMSGTELDLVKQLSERRDQLDKRARDLDTHESLLKVAEQRVDQKMKEMETLRAQLQAMVNQANTSQQAQLDNLVKIYETMKPKEAARIFETLELPVLLGVVQRMKPQRTAAVMAEMPPEKAKEITIALTRQDQLPQIK